MIAVIRDLEEDKKIRFLVIFDSITGIKFLSLVSRENPDLETLLSEVINTAEAYAKDLKLSIRAITQVIYPYGDYYNTLWKASEPIKELDVLAPGL